MTRLFLQFVIAIGIPVFTGLNLSANTDGGREPGPILHSELPDVLPGRFTGGFGEDTCQICHFDYDINEPGGSLSLQGPGEAWKPGKRYEITLDVESERLGKGGFQMTARFVDGSQAGTFEWSGNRIMQTPESITGEDVQYIQHSAIGTNATGEREITWTVEWVAPEEENGPVTFNIAANASNDDYSPFGDWIYVKEVVVLPEGFK